MKWFRRMKFPPSVVKLREDLKKIGYKSKVKLFGEENMELSVKATKRSEGYAKLLELLETMDNLHTLDLDLEKYPNVPDRFLDGNEIRLPNLFCLRVYGRSPHLDVEQIKCPNLRRLDLSGVFSSWDEKKGIEELHGDFKNLRQLQSMQLNRLPMIEVPPSLNVLSNLRYLTLFAFRSIKELPDLSELKNLISLYLAIMPLNQFPPFILELNNLRRLLFSGTDVSELPSQIDRLENLEVLYLADNAKLKTLPPSIHNLQHLWYLSVDKRLKKSGFDFDRLKEEIKLRNDAYFVQDYKSGMFVEFQP